MVTGMSETIFMVLLSVFALFGAYCLLKLLWEQFFLPREMMTAIMLTDERTIRRLPVLLETVEHRLSFPSRRIAVLCPQAFLADDAIRACILRFSEGYDVVLIPCDGWDYGASL